MVSFLSLRWYMSQTTLADYSFLRVREQYAIGIWI